MKLLFCRRCGDVRALAPTAWTVCACGASRGRYHADRLNAVIDSDHALPIGFANSSFDAAIVREAADIRRGMVRDWGRRFSAFVIPWAAPTITRPVRCPCNRERVWVTQWMAPVPCSCQQFTLKGSAQGDTWADRSPRPAAPQGKRRK